MHYSVGGRFLENHRDALNAMARPFFLPDHSKSMDELGSQHQVGDKQEGFGAWEEISNLGP